MKAMSLKAGFFRDDILVPLTKWLLLAAVAVLLYSVKTIHSHEVILTNVKSALAAGVKATTELKEAIEERNAKDEQKDKDLMQTKMEVSNMKTVMKNTHPNIKFAKD